MPDNEIKQYTKAVELYEGRTKANRPMRVVTRMFERNPSSEAADIEINVQAILARWKQTEPKGTDFLSVEFLRSKGFKLIYINKAEEEES